jgi:hypothetical protein
MQKSIIKSLDTPWVKKILIELIRSITPIIKSVFIQTFIKVVFKFSKKILSDSKLLISK